MKNVPMGTPAMSAYGQGRPCILQEAVPKMVLSLNASVLKGLFPFIRPFGGHSTLTTRVTRALYCMESLLFTV